ncbi:MAG: phosphotransferase [Firmicutes bacterium]|nr:phosphotransferase [Bacillota bacterium]
MQIVDSIFQKLDLHVETAELIRSKAGVSVYRLEASGKRLILKLFADPEDRREITNYRLLGELGIPTLPVLGYTEEAILLLDVNASEKYRLGMEEDLQDMQVAKVLAKWYRRLHDTGRQYLTRNSVSLYDETDVITVENMVRAAEVTDTIDNPLWNVVKDNFDDMKKKIAKLPRTLTYNDFYWDNLIVSKDKTEAFMFDYNLMGMGMAYGDVRNVISAMGKEAAKAFCDAYGVDGLDEEKLADDFLAHMVTLCAGSQREVFPAWAGESLEKLKSGKLLKDYEQWMRSYND